MLPQLPPGLPQQQSSQLGPIGSSLMNQSVNMAGGPPPGVLMPSMPFPSNQIDMLSNQFSQSLMLTDDQIQLQYQLQQHFLMQQQFQPLPQTNNGQLMNTQMNTPVTPSLGLQFTPPPRPSDGTEGKTIKLRANHFTIQIPKGFIYHYTVIIQPDKCPKRINRDILNTLVQAKPQLFINQRPVFDGKKNLYTKEYLTNIGAEKSDIEVTLPGEGKDRLFKVTIRYEAKVSLYALEDALQGKNMAVPYDSIQALDVIMRHLPSMRYTPVGRSFFSPPQLDFNNPLGGGREVILNLCCFFLFVSYISKGGVFLGLG